MEVRLLLADDQAVTRAGFGALLSSASGLTVVGEAEAPSTAIDLAEQLKPDVVLINFRFLDRDGLGLLSERLHREGCAPDSAILLVKSPENAIGFADALAVGGSGCVTQDAARQTLVNAVLLVSNGGVVCLPGQELLDLVARRQTEDDSRPPCVASLTDREAAVLGLLARGLSNGEIAAELHLAVTTVKKHLVGAMRKIDEPNRVRAALFAFRYGLGPAVTDHG